MIPGEVLAGPFQRLQESEMYSSPGLIDDLPVGGYHFGSNLSVDQNGTPVFVVEGDWSFQYHSGIGVP